MNYYISEHHIFKIRDRYYVFNVNNMNAYRIPEVVFNVLKKISINAKYIENYNDLKLFSVLNKLGIILNQQFEEKLSPLPARIPITNISLNIAQLCNLSCIYCYGGDGEYGYKGLMKKDTALRAIDWLIENSYDEKDISIVFFGGEPLLNFKLIKDVVEYANYKSKLANKNVHFSITTNGTKFNDTVNKFLNEHKFSVVISIDGTKEMQDANRPFKSGKGSYYYIKSKIEKFIKSRNGKKVTARATITKYNTNIKEIRYELLRLGFMNISTNIVCAIKNEEYQVGKNKINDIFDDLNEQAEDVFRKIKERKHIDNLQFLIVLKHLVNKRKKYYFCGAGRSLMAVSISGDIYPCHRFVGLDSFKMGNIQNYNSESREVYLNNSVLIYTKCMRCWARYFCGGGCLYENFQINKSLHVPNNNWCKELKKRVELSIYIYDKHDKSDKEYFYEKYIKNFTK